MSLKILSATAAGVLLLAAPSLAAAATQPVHHTQSGAKSASAAKTKMTASTTMSKAAPKTAPAKTASTKMAATKTASAQSGKAQAKAIHHHKMARTEHHRKTAENESGQAAREVRALNTLESAGYRQFDNLHSSGMDFAATAMKAGKSYDVTVTPAGRIEATKA